MKMKMKQEKLDRRKLEDVKNASFLMSSGCFVLPVSFTPPPLYFLYTAV
jgi:hypothetical protein